VPVAVVAKAGAPISSITPISSTMLESLLPRFVDLFTRYSFLG